MKGHPGAVGGVDADGKDIPNSLSLSLTKGWWYLEFRAHPAPTLRQAEGERKWQFQLTAFRFTVAGKRYLSPAT